MCKGLFEGSQNIVCVVSICKRIFTTILIAPQGRGSADVEFEKYDKALKARIHHD